MSESSLQFNLNTNSPAPLGCLCQKAMTRVNAFVPSAAGIPSPLTSYAARHKLAARFIGGNRLENAAASPVKDFVASHDGHTVITNVSDREPPVQI